MATAFTPPEESRLNQLEQRIAALETGTPISITLASLGIAGYELNKPIPVNIRKDGDEFIATFFDANISTGGDTQQAAVANLQSLVADFYDELVGTPLEQLGPSLQRQKRVLMEFVCQTS